MREAGSESEASSSPYRMCPHLAGAVTAPPDMMAAARASLPEQAFADLMEQTGGQAPTAEQLCKMVDGIRQAIQPEPAPSAGFSFSGSLVNGSWY